MTFVYIIYSLQNQRPVPSKRLNNCSFDTLTTPNHRIEAWTLFGSLFNGPTLRASVWINKKSRLTFLGQGTDHTHIYLSLFISFQSKEVDKSRENTHTHTSNQRKLQEIRKKNGLWPGLFEGQTSRTSRRTCDDFGALEVVSKNSLEGQHHLKALELVIEQKRRSKKKDASHVLLGRWCSLFRVYVFSEICWRCRWMFTF